MKTRNLLVLLMMLAMAFVSACTKDPEIPTGKVFNSNSGDGNGNGNGNGNGGEGVEGIYMGIIGFNNQLYTQPISLLNRTSQNSFIAFINALSMDDGTLLYYADNTALDWLQNATFLPSDLNVSLVTFTDGLDNGSYIFSDQYNSSSEYLSAVHNRIINDRVFGKSIDAYAIGLRGLDVFDYDIFQQNLQQLSSGSSNVYEANNINEVSQCFEGIASQIYNTTTTVNATVEMGKYDNNTMIRITFDNVTDAESSIQYIQGTYCLDNGKGQLSNISYCGLQSSSGSVVYSSGQEGLYDNYTFEALRTSNGNYVPDIENVRLWHNNGSVWIHDSEFAFSASAVHKSAVTVLVLDCSTSLGVANFGIMKEAVNDFINIIGG